MSPEAKYLYLTTIGRRSGLARRIEIWFTRHAGRYYLVAEHGLKAHWVRNLLAEPAVRARVGRRSFRARARVVDATVGARSRRGHPGAVGGQVRLGRRPRRRDRAGGVRRAATRRRASEAPPTI